MRGDRKETGTDMDLRGRMDRWIDDWKKHGRDRLLFEVAPPLLSILAALLLGAILISAVGLDPVRSYRFLLMGSLGTRVGIAETLVKAAPLILAGLGFAFAFQCGLFNIGGEGQIYLGALGAALVGIYVTGLPSLLHVPLALLAGTALGAVWGAIPGYLKARLGISEIINTIMLNYVGIYFVSYLVFGPLREPPGYNPQTARMLSSAMLPRFLAGTRAHVGFFLALAVAVLVFYVIYRTTFGYQIRAVGFNRNAAKYAGIRVRRSLVLTMAISGALAGLAGANEILGIQGRLIIGFSPGYGFDAIAVALVGKAHPFGVILAGLLFGALNAGANVMQRNAGVPVQITYIIQGLVVLFVIGSDFLVSRHRARADKRSVIE